MYLYSCSKEKMNVEKLDNRVEAFAKRFTDNLVVV